MLIAVTGATGFLGRYIVNHLLEQGHRCRCWYRVHSDRGGFVDDSRIEWLPGELNQASATGALVDGADAVVHAAVEWHGNGVVSYAMANVVGSLRLMEASRAAGASRFIFIGTCAVHEIILDDRELDEAHPLWPTSQYGAYKAAVEKFVHAYGFGGDWCVCSLRPTGIYGLRRPSKSSRWLDIVRHIAAGRTFRSTAGGKEVHAADCAKATSILLDAPADRVRGHCFNCYDLYVAEQDVARMANLITHSTSEIEDLNQGPKHQIDTTKLQRLGMQFGGRPMLEAYVRQLVEMV